MCESPIVDDRLIKYYITKHPLNRITRFLIEIYYHHVRIMQVKYLNEPIDVRNYTVETCECRLNIRKCKNRLDTCFKRTKEDNREVTEKKIQILNQENLVRIQVNTANWKHEVCHCCACCCFPVRVHNLFPRRLIYASNYVASINLQSCLNCKKCIIICPFGAIQDSIAVEIEKCLGCGLCEKNCQVGAITMIERDSESVPKPHRLISMMFLLFFHIYFYIMLKFSEFSHLVNHEAIPDL